MSLFNRVDLYVFFFLWKIYQFVLFLILELYFQLLESNGEIMIFIGIVKILVFKLGVINCNQ